MKPANTCNGAPRCRPENSASAAEACPFDGRCRSGDGRQPRCTVQYAFAENHMFVDGDAGCQCPYRLHFGQAYICTCPVHYTDRGR
jgi:hypothetical protein